MKSIPILSKDALFTLKEQSCHVNETILNDNFAILIHRQDIERNIQINHSLLNKNPWAVQIFHDRVSR